MLLPKHMRYSYRHWNPIIDMLYLVLGISQLAQNKNIEAYFHLDEIHQGEIEDARDIKIAFLINILNVYACLACLYGEWNKEMKHI